MAIFFSITFVRNVFIRICLFFNFKKIKIFYFFVLKLFLCFQIILI
jgi:hypothetical protein